MGTSLSGKIATYPHQLDSSHALEAQAPVKVRSQRRKQFSCQHSSELIVANNLNSGITHRVMVGQDNPAVEVQSIVIYNDKDAAGRWIPLRIEIGSWITLKPTASGPWSKDARVHGEESFVGVWKAQIVRFKFHGSIVRGRDVQKLVAIQVRHAYQRRQLELDPLSSASEPCVCNYLYPSYWDDLVPPSSILDVILVLHHEIGKAGHNGRSHRQLL